MSVKLDIQTQLMSAFGANLDKKLGMTLPVPFIENIIIDESGENISIKAAIYFNMDDYGDINFGDFTGSLENVNFYAMLAFDREYTATSGSEMTSETNLSDIINGDVDILSKAAYLWEFVDETDQSHQYVYPSSNPDASITPNIYPFDPISEWDLSDTYYMDDRAGAIKKIVTELTISLTSLLPQAHLQYNFLDYAEATSPFSQTSREIIKNVGFLTFSSILPLYDEVVQPDATKNNLDEILYLNVTFPTSPMIDFYSSFTSDINSFVFFKDREIAAPDLTIYITPGGTIVEDPILGLDLLYHTPTNMTVPDIIRIFKPLASVPEGGPTVIEPALQTTMDSLLTLLETNDNSPDILTKINTFLQSFVEKSSATAMGRFFRNVSKQLVRVNNIIIASPTAAKQLINNPTVIDKRGTSSTGDYVPPDTSINAADYIFTKSIFVNRQTGSYGGEDYLVDEGSFFFDYENLLKQKSKIAQYLNVSKLEALFGSDVLCNRFFIENVQMGAINITDGEYFFTLDSEFSTQDYAASDANIPAGTLTIDDEANTDYIYSGGPVRPYLYIRNFNTMNFIEDDGLNTVNNGRFYKLMCYQFQHVIQDWETNSFIADYDYTVQFILRDHTNTLYLELYYLVREIQDLLDEYYVLASEHCSYNNTDDFFNEFFINGIAQYYVGDAGNTPWIKAAFMYIYLKDLWDNSYGGDQDEILKQARNLSAQIGPTAGTLSSLEDLRNKYDTLVESIFDEDTVDFLRIEYSQYVQIGNPDGYYSQITLGPTGIGPLSSITTVAPWNNPEGETTEAETVSATLYEEQSGYVTYEFGKIFDAWTEETNVDTNALYALMLTKSDTDIWPQQLAPTGGIWGINGSVYTDITDFIMEWDQQWGSDLQCWFTTPEEHPTNSNVYISYKVIVAESDGKVRVRPFKCSGTASDCIGTEIGDGRYAQTRWTPENLTDISDH